MKRRFSIRAAIMCAMLSPSCIPQSLPGSQTKRAPTGQSAVAVRAALQPWIRAVEELSNKSKDAEVIAYLEVLHNAAIMAPSGEGSPAALAQRVLAPPPKVPGAWVGVIIIDSHQNLPSGRWQQLASTTDFAAEYHEDTNTMYLRNDLPQIPVIRGLLVVHEMRHWWQTANSEASKDLDSRPRREVDAYQTEFRILDALMLHGYQGLLASERVRVRRFLADPKGPLLRPDTDNPLLDQTFGGFANPAARQMAAAEITVRAAFAELDTLPAATALRRKTDLLRSLGYN